MQYYLPQTITFSSPYDYISPSSHFPQIANTSSPILFLLIPYFTEIPKALEDNFHKFHRKATHPTASTFEQSAFSSFNKNEMSVLLFSTAFPFFFHLHRDMAQVKPKCFLSFLFSCIIDVCLHWCLLLQFLHKHINRLLSWGKI